MVSASFVQTSFLGGQWSAFAQGRMADPEYKTAMNVCYNGYPLEAGSWTRRQGFRYLAHTKGGNPGVLRAFDFSVTQPYQMEFTDGYVRFFAGLALTTFDDGEVDVINITTDNPGVVTVNTVPAGWANGATVIFDIESIPCSTTLLCGRQFTIANLDSGASTFTLLDALTGAPIDGADIAYSVSPNVGGNDQVKRVFELATPYTNGQWSTLRTVQDNVSVLLLHKGVQPQAITKGVVPAPFQIAPQAFLDGPYFAVNTTATTLTPSAKTGSITLTASSTIGINDGQGFLSTDVGRLVRFQCAPAAWAIGTTYAKAATVLGSDNNIYDSLTGGNIGHDPTTDDGTNWELNETEVVWVWLVITAHTDSTHVTATVQDAASGVTDDNVPNASFPSLTPTNQWRLGVFSDTTGWPSCGVYHEGRIWLSGVVRNRFDASYSNDPFNFSPTSIDGTVSDANAISEVLNATEANDIFWMLSTEEGVIMGTQAGEWRIRASVLNDPISPSSIQGKRVSKYGCANIEPVEASLPVFVQRQQRKVLAHMPVSDSKYLGGNLTRNADDLTAGGIAEIRWQQEPNLTVWCRRNDGILIGSTFQRVQNYSQFGGKDDSFNGWHIHALGSGRIVDSIATGPAYDGLSDALYMISNKTDPAAPDYNVHWVECLMPLFDSSQADWSAFFVDGGANPCCAKVCAVSRGDTFDGVTIYGLWNMNGLTVAPVIGGLDLGDRLVTDGSIDIPYLSDPEKSFTLSFLQAQNNGTDYGVFETDYVFTDTIAGIPAPYPNNSEGALKDMTSGTGHNYLFADVDIKTRKFYGLNTTDNVYAIINFDTFVESTVDTLDNYDGGLSIEAACFMANEDDGFHYLSTGSGDVAQINPTTYAHRVAPTSGEGGTSPAARDFMPINASSIAVVGNSGVSSEAFLTILNTVSMTWTAGLQFEVDEDYCEPIKGPGTVLYAIGSRNTYSSGDTIGLYRVNTLLAGSMVKSHAIAPSDIDATWTTFSGVSRGVLDAKDGNIILGFRSASGPTQTTYTVKMNPFNGDIIWKLAIPMPAFALPARKHPITTQHTAWTEGENGIRYLDTMAGTSTLIAWAGSGQVYLGSDSYFDPTDGSVTAFGDQASWSTVPNLLGPYSQAHETTGIHNGTNNKLYFGVAGDSSTEVVQYKAATSAGASYTSKGQLLRPDYGVDAGARNGPAFGKKRRLHWWSAAFVRARNVIIGTIFNLNVMRPVSFASDGGNPLPAPGLFSGTRTNTIDNDESFEAQIAWQISRPYPCVVTAVGGYIESVDK